MSRSRKRVLVAIAALAATLVVSVAATSAGADRLAGPPKGYAEARTEVLRDGREVAALVAAGDVQALFARFTPELAKAFPRRSLEDLLEKTLAEGAIGARLGESALPLGPESRAYATDHRWAGRVFGIELVFDADGMIAGGLLEPRKPLPPDPKAGYRLKTRLELPFTDTWWVFWGGPSERQNYHVIAPDQRHAYDLVVWRRGGTHRGDGRENRDYWAWGRPVLAPADGVVVATKDGVRDNRPVVDLSNPANPAGNHVVLSFGNGEFALLAHLRRGSVRVRPGQRVAAGDVLGLCGNSGNSSEPHLHFHVQDRKRLFGAAKGLPVSFSDYRAGGRRVARGAPVQGEFIANER